MDGWVMTLFKSLFSSFFFVGGWRFGFGFFLATCSGGFII